MNATNHRPFLRWALLVAAAASVGAVVPAGVAAASGPQPAAVVITGTSPKTVVVPGKGDDGGGPKTVVIGDPGGDGPGPKVVAVP